MLQADGASRAHHTPRDFPSLIQGALARIAGRVGRCAELDAQPRLLLAELVRCVSYRAPAAPFRVSNDTLAQALGISVRSVGRLKAVLENAGWIERRQVKSRRRGMQVADTWLTRGALAALGLGEGDVDNLPEWYPQPRSMRRPAASNAFQTLPQSSSKRRPAPSGPGSVEEVQEDKDGRSLSAAELQVLRELQEAYGDDLALMDEDAEGGSGFEVISQADAAEVEGVPSDLQLLHRVGLGVPAIRKLMGLARRYRTRLGDVVAAAGEYILKAKRAFSYVLKLLKSGKDWAALASSPEGGKLAKKGEGAWSPTPVESLRVADSAHSLLAGGLCAVSADGRIWSVRDGVVCETDLAAVHRGAWGTPIHSSSADCYERKARAITELHDRGELQLMSSQEVEALAAEDAELEGRLRSAAAGKALVDQARGLAWRFGPHGGIEQAELRVIRTRTGRGCLPWAHQLQPNFARRLAKLWRDGVASITSEEALLTRAASASTPKSRRAVLMSLHSAFNTDTISVQNTVSY